MRTSATLVLIFRYDILADVQYDVTLALGASAYDLVDPMGKMSFNIIATFAEFESDLIKQRTKRN